MKRMLLPLLLVCSLVPSVQAGFRPETYVCRRATETITIDGHLNEGSWLRAPVTQLFVDIEGDRLPPPSLGTRVKMVWDDKYVYFAVMMEEPNVWGTVSKRDDPVYAFDNDLEIFLDVNNDGKWYIEFEMNALNVVYDLVRENKSSPLIIPWDIEGIQTAVQIDGTLNKPDDVDRGWTCEIAWPMSSLREHAGEMPIPPHDGDTWRIDFPRVECEFDYESKFLRKVPRVPVQNWVWCSQGVINNHWPEAWGFLRFSTEPVGLTSSGDIPPENTAPFLTPDLKKRKKVKPGDMVRIPGGEFTQGPDPIDEKTSPAHTVTVKDFYIDRYEVTVAEYAAFLNDVRDEKHFYRHMPHHDCGIVKNTDGSYSVTPGREEYPIVYVGLENAEAYAAWAGKRLPTESEWERACRFSDNRPYPWGENDLTPELCNFNYHYGGTLPVGCFPRGVTKQGVHDMAGNVWELCAGEFESYPGGEVSLERRPQTVYRGGCWASPPKMMHAAVRDVRAMRSPFIGFRCARDAE